MRRYNYKNNNQLKQKCNYQTAAAPAVTPIPAAAARTDSAAADTKKVKDCTDQCFLTGYRRHSSCVDECLLDFEQGRLTMKEDNTQCDGKICANDSELCKKIAERKGLHTNYPYLPFNGTEKKGYSPGCYKYVDGKYKGYAFYGAFGTQQEKEADLKSPRARIITLQKHTFLGEKPTKATCGDEECTDDKPFCWVDADKFKLKPSCHEKATPYGTCYRYTCEIPPQKPVGEWGRPDEIGFNMWGDKYEAIPCSQCKGIADEPFSEKDGVRYKYGAAIGRPSDAQCDEWAARGDCEHGPGADAMKISCPAACGVQTPQDGGKNFECYRTDKQVKDKYSACLRGCSKPDDWQSFKDFFGHTCDGCPKRGQEWKIINGKIKYDNPSVEENQPQPRCCTGGMADYMEYKFTTPVGSVPNAPANITGGGIWYCPPCPKYKKPPCGGL